MILELHVWGPGFGLPSIDAQCLAAITYLKRAIPHDSWRLIASSDPALSPTKELPALRDGEVWIGGFRNIMHYIAQFASGGWVLDAGIPEQEGADCIAYSAYIESHGQPLLDLSLYVSSQNYSTTRAIYPRIQPFPLPYLTPTSIRATAKSRTAYLGLSTLDIDDAQPDRSAEKSIIPESLRRPRHTITSMLASSPEMSAQIKLDGLATSFFSTLQDLKREKRYFLSNERVSSLDCLALGYLSLMLFPDLPQAWLRRSLDTKFPRLCRWVKAFREETLGDLVGPADIYLSVGTDGDDRDCGKPKSPLPWTPPTRRGLLHIGSILFASIADSLPLIGPLRRHTRMWQYGGKTIHDDNSSPLRRYGTILGGVFVSLSLLVGVVYHHGTLSLPFEAFRDDAKKRKLHVHDYGVAGAALGLYASQLDMKKDKQEDLQTRSEPSVEVEVEPGMPGGGDLDRNGSHPISVGSTHRGS